MNTYRVKITGYPPSWLKGQIGSPMDEESAKRQLAVYLEKLCLMRTARKVGDVETINATQLGRLQQQQIPFEKVTNISENATRYLVNEHQLHVIAESVMNETEEVWKKGEMIIMLEPSDECEVPARSVGIVKHVDAVGTITAEFSVEKSAQHPDGTIMARIHPDSDKVIKWHPD